MMRVAALLCAVACATAVEWECFGGHRSTAPSVTRVAVATLVECKALCEGDASCSQVTFSRDGCELKSTTDTKMESADAETVTCRPMSQISRLADEQADQSPVDDEVTPVPTPVPATVNKWCIRDADCRKHGDTAATCDSAGRCVCNLPFKHKVVGEETHYDCFGEVPSPPSRGFIITIVFRWGLCVTLRVPRILKLLLSIVARVLGVLSVSSSSNECGSFHMALEVDILQEEISTKMKTLNADLQKEIFATGDQELTAAVNNGVVPVAQTDIDVSTGASAAADDCFTPNSARAVVLNNVCTPLVCSTGYEKTVEIGNGTESCIVSATAAPRSVSDDDGLSTPIIIAIVIGSIAVCLIFVVLALWCLVCKSEPAHQNEAAKEAPEGEAPAGDPFNQDGYDACDVHHEFSDVLV
eukprot:TRINITY_DN50429_c0_g1_i1.p2 TRINITY_DN50429_c0_g1~~TRINITY_DN50429_c0_g1_i1.p2  ORF type:complete len:433 (+),score=170.81 TRINITY_DN50429_c0_g1_i1:62-1300(+)